MIGPNIWLLPELETENENLTLYSSFFAMSNHLVFIRNPTSFAKPIPVVLQDQLDLCWVNFFVFDDSHFAIKIFV